MLGWRNNLERRIAQNRRLLYRDFPWLWAVSPRWYLGGHEIKVIRCHKAFGVSEITPALVSKPVDIGYGKLLQVFVYIRLTNDFHEVKEVELQPDLSLAEFIMDGVAIGNIIESIVLVYKSPEGEQEPNDDWRRIYSIFCSDDLLFFNRLISNLKND